MEDEIFRESFRVNSRAITERENMDLGATLKRITEEQDILEQGIQMQDKENQLKCGSDKRRERNILSSRKYRAKRRERMKNLDDVNQQLSLQIQAVENEIETMKRVIYRFVGHASECGECGILQIKFE